MYESGASTPDEALLHSPGYPPQRQNFFASSRSGSTTPGGSVGSISPTHASTINTTSSASDQHQSSSEHASSSQSISADNSVTPLVPAQVRHTPVVTAEELFSEIKSLSQNSPADLRLKVFISNADFRQFLDDVANDIDICHHVDKLRYDWTASFTPEGKGIFEVDYMPSLGHDGVVFPFANRLISGVNSNFTKPEDRCEGMGSSYIKLDGLFADRTYAEGMSQAEGIRVSSSKSPDGQLFWNLGKRRRPTTVFEFLRTQTREQFIDKAILLIEHSDDEIKAVIGIDVDNPRSTSGSPITPGRASWIAVMSDKVDIDPDVYDIISTEWTEFRDENGQFVEGSMSISLRRLVPDDINGMDTDKRIVEIPHRELFDMLTKAEAAENRAREPKGPEPPTEKRSTYRRKLTTTAAPHFAVQSKRSASESPPAVEREGDTEFISPGQASRGSPVQTRHMTKKSKTT